jgi:hypothetical protein
MQKVVGSNPISRSRKGLRLQDKIRESTKFASYPQSNVLPLPGGAFGITTGSATESVRS